MKRFVSIIQHAQYVYMRNAVLDRIYASLWVNLVNVEIYKLEVFTQIIHHSVFCG